MARRLSTATDELNAKLTRVEKTLGSLRLGVSARVDMSGEDEGDGKYANLAFMKRGAQWGLYLVTGREDWHDAREEETPLLSAPKKYRSRAAEVINDLLAALIEAARKQIDDIERANRQLDEALDGALRDVALADNPLAEPTADPFDDEIPF